MHIFTKLASFLVLLAAIGAAHHFVAIKSFRPELQSSWVKQVNASPQDDAKPKGLTSTNQLSAREKAAHILNRLSFGAKPGQIEELAKKGWQSWVHTQLRPLRIDDSELENRVASDFPSLSMSLEEIYSTYWPQAPKDFRDLPKDKQDSFIQKRNQLRAQVQRELRNSVVLRATLSNRQLQEVIVEFWRNHFNVDQSKDNCIFFANHYEEHIIRKHAFGNFGEFLLATARHPAMLIYLDNDVSQKPLTKEEKKQLEYVRKARRANPNAQLGAFGKTLARHTGLNENYARELMELHTLGVDRFYTQKDVYELARILTGWTHGWTSKTYEGVYGFHFRESVHDEKPKKLLGVSISSDDGESEGEKAIGLLAKHPGTARFICWKLCRYLLNDEPPAQLVDKAADVFRASSGNLPRVYRTILLSSQFLDRASYRAKFKSPFEFVVSAMRATDSSIESPQTVLRYLERMGQPIYRCEDPTGFFDQTEAWLDPGVLVHRWDFALRLAANKVKGVKISPSSMKAFAELQKTNAKAAAGLILPEGLDKQAIDIIGQAKDAKLGLGLLLGSPAFQQQ